MKVVLYFKKLNIGGAERSTIRLLNAFVNEGHDVSLLLNTKGGSLENELSKKINIIYFYHDDGSLKNWNRKISSLYKIGFKNFFKASLQFFLGWLRKIILRIKHLLIRHILYSNNSAHLG